MKLIESNIEEQKRMKKEIRMLSLYYAFQTRYKLHMLHALYEK